MGVLEEGPEVRDLKEEVINAERRCIDTGELAEHNGVLPYVAAQDLLCCAGGRASVRVRQVVADLHRDDQHVPEEPAGVGGSVAGWWRAGKARKTNDSSARSRSGAPSHNHSGKLEGGLGLDESDRKNRTGIVSSR